MLAGCSVLAVFSGPHAYVSPTWYRAADTVPTWNYVAVHAYGVCEVIEDTDQILPVLAETVATYEAGMATPWQFRPNEAHSRALAAGVVGVRIPVDRLEGKWKLNQNHPPERQALVATELEQSTDPGAREIAALMRENTSGQR
jgi:transcriptional regulator